MKQFIYEQKINKETLIEKMTIQEAFKYANMILYVHEYLTKSPYIPFMSIENRNFDIDYMCNNDLVYGEENFYTPNISGYVFLDIYSGIRYHPESEIFFINTNNEFKINPIENTEESIFQNSTIYSDYELKHNIILWTLRQANCREFFMDLNYLEIMYNIFTGITEPPTQHIDDSTGELYYGYL